MSHFEQVLAWMEPWPQWREALVTLQADLEAQGCRVYRDSQGAVFIGLVDREYGTLRKDAERNALFGALRERFHAVRELDAELGNQSLANIVDHYFGNRLEVRG